MDSQTAKKAAAEAAVSRVENDMIVGLGTGSTAYYAIQLIGKRIAEGLRIRGAVPTSRETEKLAKQNKIPLISDFTYIDLTIDGADEVEPAGDLIKGGGGALTREKIVAAASTQEIIVVDEGKLVEQLGAFPLPVEVLPFGWRFVQSELSSLGCETHLRKKDENIFVTDNQNYILDCIYDRIVDPGLLSREINSLPGVLENGLFVGLADLVIVGSQDGSFREIQVGMG